MGRHGNQCSCKTLKLYQITFMEILQIAVHFACAGNAILYFRTHRALLDIFAMDWAAFCTYSMGFQDTLRHCQRARACRSGGRHAHLGLCHPLFAIFSLKNTAFCTYSMGSQDTLRHCQRARACRCGGEKSRALRQGRVFQLFAQMAPWDTLGSGLDQHFAPELFAGTSKTTTFYMCFTVPSRAQ